MHLGLKAANEWLAILLNISGGPESKSQSKNCYTEVFHDVPVPSGKFSASTLN
jgi:hypothetical protein